MKTSRRPYFKSVFSKYMAFQSIAVVLCILLLGLVQILLSARFWTHEQEKNMTEDARVVAVSIGERVEKNAIGGYSIRLDEESAIPAMIRLIAKTSGVELMVASNEGGIIIRSLGCEPKAKNIPPATMEVISEYPGGYFGLGTMSGLFPTSQYVAAAPIVHNDTRVGYVFVLSSADSFSTYIGVQINVYLAAALTAALLVFVASYITTYRLVRPLRQMAAITKRFGEGDFSCRLAVRGEDEVAQLATALNEMAVSLSAVEGMSRSFVANVSHELKTPMTTISGFVDGVLDGTIPPERQKYYLQIVSDEIKRLSRLVNAMLNLSRIDNGSMALRPTAFDFSEMVCTTALSFEQRIEQKSLSVSGFETFAPVTLVGDRDLLTQVVYNLLDNAVKFADQNGTLSLALHREPDSLCFAVRNSGSGVSAEELPHLFERFYKSDKSRSADKTGVGLGLYIVHHVIRLHGGEITVQSDGNSYTEFSFRLPIGMPPEDGLLHS